jgi:autotransporter adhesin
MKKQILVSAVLMALSLSATGYVHAQTLVGGTSATQPCNQANSNLACGNGASLPATDPQGDATGESIAIGGIASGSQTTEVGSGSIAGYASTVIGGAASGLANNSNAGTNSASYYGFGLAGGNGAQANGYASTALGGYAPIANGYASTSIGLHATTGTLNAPGGNGDIALGAESTTMVASGAQTSGNIAIGSSQGITEGGAPSGISTTLGQTSATGGNAIALGTNAVSSGEQAIAIGENASASSDQGIAIGAESQTTGNYGGVAIGGGFANQGKYNIAGQFGSALGYASQAQGVGDTAVGAYANTGSGNPTDPTSDAQDSYRTAVGYKSSATGEVAVALGAFNTASGDGSVALGYGSSSTGDNSVALGAGSTDGGMANVISVGGVGSERRIINVAPGVNGTDAVNVNQLNGAIAPLNTSINTLTTDYSNLSTTVTNNQTADGTAISAADAAAAAAAAAASNAQGTANGAQSTATAALGTATTALTTGQQNTVQINALIDGQAGVCTVSGGALSCQAGKATGTGAQAVGTGATATGTGAMAYGAGAVASSAGAVAQGQNAQATGGNSVAIGNGAVASGNNSVALGAGSVASRDNSVDVGGRQITDVAAGVAPTDAANVSQVQGAANQAYGWARQYAAQAAAQAMAIPSTPTLQPGQKWVGAAGGNYDGQSAVGVGFAYQVNDGWSIGGGMSQAVGSTAPGGRHLAFKVQTGYAW